MSGPHKQSPIIEKICENPDCKLPFSTTRSNKKYHSPVCGMNYWMKMHPRRGSSYQKKTESEPEKKEE